MSLKCSALYLAQFRSASPHLLASGDGTKSATVIGDVYVHPSAKVHPTAKVVIYLLRKQYPMFLSFGNIYLMWLTRISTIKDLTSFHITRLGSTVESNVKARNKSTSIVD